MSKRPTAHLTWFWGSLVLAMGLAGQAFGQYGAPQPGSYPQRSPGRVVNQPNAPATAANQAAPNSDDPYDPFVFSQKQQRATGRTGWRPVQPKGTPANAAIAVAAPAAAPPAAPRVAQAVAQPAARGQVVPASGMVGRSRARQAAHYVQPGPAPTMGEHMAAGMNYGDSSSGPMVPYPHHPGMDSHGPGCNCGGGGGVGGPVMGGPVFQGGGYEDYGWEGGPSCGGGDCGGGSCGGCGDCNACPQPCAQHCCYPFQLPYHIAIFGGTHGFKGPRDFGINGNFGFQEGINTAGALNFLPNIDLNYQVGWQAVQSNLSGTQFEDDTRHQYFLTAGVFHRQVCGLQYGVVWDWYRDYYFDNIDLTQIRGQISLLNQAGHELGFATHLSTNDDADTADGDDAIRWEATNQFVGFYRMACPCNGDFRFWGGFTGDGDGLLGADFHVPLNDWFSIMGSTNYLIPEEGSGPNFGGPENEAWNVSLNIVWHYGGRARVNGPCGGWKPMFDVADNGSFMVQTQDPDDSN